MSTSSKPPSKASLGLIFLVVFLDLVGFGIVIPILPYYAQNFGATAAELGWLMALYSAMQFFFAPFWGSLSDRIGRKPVLIISVLGAALGMLILASAHSLTMLFVGRIFAGICGANISTASAYIADITSEKDRTKGMGIIGAGFGLGFIFGPAIGGILSQYGYNFPIYVASALAFLNALFIFAKLPETTTKTKAPGMKRFSKDSIAKAFGNGKSRAAILLFFLFTLAFTQMEVTFALYTKEKFAFTPQQAGLWLGAMGLVMALLQGGIIGKLSRIFTEPQIVLIGSSLLAIGFGLIGALHTLAAFLTGLFFLAVGNGLNNPSLSSMASKGANSQGVTLGVYQSFGSLARIIGPLIAGYAYEYSGRQVPFIISAMFVLIGHVALLTLNSRWKKNIA